MICTEPNCAPGESCSCLCGQAAGIGFLCCCSGGGGGGVCTGCYPDQNGRGVYSIQSTTVTQVSPTSATVSWIPAPGGGACPNRNSLVVFVGRSKEVVDANCGWDGSKAYSPGMTSQWDINANKGTGGLGGGGDGAFFSPSNVGNGVNGTGGGGGGAFGNPNALGGNGGSGIVIIRYPTGRLIATGGAMSTSGGDTVHTFSSSGTFTVSAGSTSQARVLVVGGGGGGGCYYKSAGGGGAGGVVQQSNVTLSAGSFPVTVGGGGGGCPFSPYKEPQDKGWRCAWSGDGRSPGANSSFLSYVAYGGGGGGSYFQTYLTCKGGQACCVKTAETSGGNGGSGGGSHYFDTYGGAGVPGQGNHGGGTPASSGAGGGGGAGTPGQDGQISFSGGKGGDGVASDISGTTQYYGGGGGGGTGGFLPAGCYKMIYSNTSARSLTVGGLAPNTTYYFKVIPEYYFTDKASGEDTWQMCGTVGAKANIACTATLSPASATIPQGGTGSFSTTVTGASGPTVKYTSKLPYFSFTPDSTTDATSLYKTTVSALQQTSGSQSFTADVYVQPTDITPACSATGSVTVTPPANPWWQVKDSDIQSNGFLSSKVPVASFFGLPGPGTYPGVVAYATSTDLTGTNVAQTSKWLANSSWTPKGIYDYAYFAGQIPADVTFTTVDSGNLASQITTAGTSQYGYYWYKYDGAAPANAGAPLSLSSPISIGTKKVVLLVDNADFNIGKTINGITKGQGFFLVVVKGNIKVDPGVGGGATPSLEGLYVADNTFQTGGLPRNPNGTGNDIQLRVRGSIVGYGGVTLQRSLAGVGNVTNPAEYLEYAPDQIMLFPSKLGVRKIVWKEVAP